MPSLDPSEMTPDERARPEDTFRILPSGRPDLQRIEFATQSSKPTVGHALTTSYSALTNCSIAWTVNSAASVTLLFANFTVNVIEAGGGDVYMRILRDGAVEVKVQIQARGIGRWGEMMVGLDTGMVAGAHTWTFEARKSVSSGNVQLSVDSSVEALLIDR